jgi:hypothetical protein
LPAPKPTIKQATNKPVVTNMKKYYNYGGGCIAGECKVKLKNG